MISAAKSLFDGHKDKSALKSSIKGLQICLTKLGIERISNNLESRLHQNLQSCEYFSLQFDEVGDISDVAQMLNEEFVKLLTLHEFSRGEDIFNAFLTFVKYTNLPLSKLAITTADW
ncbi:hypothetical protein C0J52_25093 [Blattella germanica]|nr:hypothetical protein C0J52_25093 [Blattella germanica]